MLWWKDNKVLVDIVIGESGRALSYHGHYATAEKTLVFRKVLLYSYVARVSAQHPILLDTMLTIQSQNLVTDCL